MKLNVQAIVQSLIVALLPAIAAAAISTYVEVKLLREDVDRLEVWVDQLWHEPKR